MTEGMGEGGMGPRIRKDNGRGGRGWVPVFTRVGSLRE